MGFSVFGSRLWCGKWCLCLLDPSWPWIWSSSLYGTCLSCKEMVCALGGGIKLLVILCPVLDINCNMKHKTKLKQTQALCWETKHKPVPGIFCLCLWMVRYRTCISDITIALTSATNTSNIWVTPVCEMAVCVCRVRLAREFSLGFSDLLVDAVLLPDFFFPLRIKWHLEHVNLDNWCFC